jgi:hypothetical protein
MNSLISTNAPARTCFDRTIQLTPIYPEEGTLAVSALRLITYVEELGFTCLRLIGGETLKVRETAGQIDQLIREAANAS